MSTSIIEVDVSVAVVQVALAAVIKQLHAELIRAEGTVARLLGVSRERLTLNLPKGCRQAS